MNLRASLLGVALVCLFAAPAVAQTSVSVAIVGLKDGDVIAGTVHLRADAASDVGIKRLDLSINDVVVAAIEPSELRRKVSVDYDWNTVWALGGSGMARNGRYMARAVAISNADKKQSVQIVVVVDNAATTPQGFSSQISEDVATMSWSPNPEPDIVGYIVQRDSGGGFLDVAQVSDTSYSETVAPGDHSYRVVALRSSEVSPAGKASAASASSSVHLDPPPTPQADDGGSGPTAGGKPVKNGKVGSVRLRDFRLDRGRNLAGAGGLTSFARLPQIGLTALPRLPEAGDAALAWGTYENQLPYELPEEGPIEVRGLGLSAASSSWSVIPPDGLRWVAAGMLLLALSGLLKILALRLRELPPRT